MPLPNPSQVWLNGCCSNKRVCFSCKRQSYGRWQSWMVIESLYNIIHLSKNRNLPALIEGLPFERCHSWRWCNSHTDTDITAANHPCLISLRFKTDGRFVRWDGTVLHKQGGIFVCLYPGLTSGSGAGCRWSPCPRSPPPPAPRSPWQSRCWQRPWNIELTLKIKSPKTILIFGVE